MYSFELQRPLAQPSEDGESGAGNTVRRRRRSLTWMVSAPMVVIRIYHNHSKIWVHLIGSVSGYNHWSINHVLAWHGINLRWARRARLRQTNRGKGATGQSRLELFALHQHCVGTVHSPRTRGRLHARSRRIHKSSTWNHFATPFKDFVRKELGLYNIRMSQIKHVRVA